jgi:hypothetical protein
MDKGQQDFLNIKRYTILGERCSGTNWLEKLINDNFECQIDWTFGWKHWFAYKGYDDVVIQNKDVIFLGIVRNPIDYFMSFYTIPHHQPIERTKNIETFLLSQFYSVWDTVKSEEIQFDRKFDGTRYKNIFEMRSLKCKYLYDTMPLLSSKYYFIRYEDLKSDPVDILKKIKQKFNLTVKNKEYFIEKRYVHRDQIFANRVCRENYKVDNDVKNIIKLNLEIEIENRMGYTLFN